MKNNLIFIFFLLLLCINLFAGNYADMHITNSSTDQISGTLTSDNWHQVTGFSSFNRNFWLYSSDALTPENSNAYGNYMIRFSLSFMASPGTWTTAIFVNGVEQSDLNSIRYISSDTITGNISSTQLIAISSLLDVVTLQVKSDSDATYFVAVHSEVVLVEMNDASTAQYGEMYIANNNTSHTLTTANTFQQVTGFTAGEISGWTFSNDELTANSGAGGTYLFILSTSFNGNGPFDYDFGVSHNDNNPQEIIFKRTMTDHNDIGNAFACGIIGISAGNTIDIKAKANSDNKDIVIYDANLSLLRLDNIENSTYGSMKIDSNNNATTINAGWNQETNTEITSLSNDSWIFSPSTDDLTPINQSAGVYMVNYFLSITYADAIESIGNYIYAESDIFVGTSAQNNLITRRRLEQVIDKDIGCVSGVGLVRIDDPQDKITLRLSTENDRDIKVLDANINLFRIEDSETPLAVTLSSFNCLLQNDIPLLNWVTQSETNCAYWNIYRSENENGFIINDYLKVNDNLIYGMGTTSEPSEYEFNDEYEVENSTTYWYWLENIDFSGHGDLHGPISLSIPEDQPDSPEVPGKFGLFDTYPNPFNPKLNIKYAVKSNEEYELVIYNAKGRKVKTLKSETSMNNSIRELIWNGNDDSGKPVSSGIYYTVLKSENLKETKRVILLK